MGIAEKKSGSETTVTGAVMMGCFCERVLRKNLESTVIACSTLWSNSKPERMGGWRREDLKVHM